MEESSTYNFINFIYRLFGSKIVANLTGFIVSVIQVNEQFIGEISKAELFNEL